MRTRLLIGGAGIALALFGVFRLVTEVGFGDLLVLLLWLGAAVLIHDGILSPAVVAIGWAIGRVVPPRGRRYLQFGLIVAALVTVVAIPLILREDTQPGSKAILQQAYGGNLTLLLGLIAAVTLIAYAVRVARKQPTSPAPTVPTPADPTPRDPASP